MKYYGNLFPKDSSIEDFVGSKPENSQDFVLNCLYEKNSNEFTEELVGTQKLRTGTIYLSPLQLVPLFGEFKLDPRKVNFILDGSEYLTTKVSAKEELFDSCIAVEFTIKDKLRG